MTNVSALKNIFIYLVLGLIMVLAPFLILFAVILRSIELILKYRKFKNIENEVAVVTGAAGGLGRCIALQLARKGCHVAVVDINLKGAEETVELIRSQYKVKCKAYEVDVTNHEQAINLNKEIAGDLGIATILINNAGIILLSNFMKPKIEEIQRMINVNLLSHFVMNSVFIPNMKGQRKGHIVAISSVAGAFPLLNNEAYCATKSGVNALMSALRLKFKYNDFGDIRTTTILPNFLKTNADLIHVLDEVKFSNGFDRIDGDDAGREIVHAMLRNEVEVFLPRPLNVLTRLYHLFPAQCQGTLGLIVSFLCIGSYKKFRSINIKTTKKQ